MFKNKIISRKVKTVLFFAVWTVSFIVISLGISKTGQTWDEIAYFNAGREYLKSAARLDFSQQAWRANKEHPGFAKYIYGISSIGAYKNHTENFNPGRYASAAMLALSIALITLFMLEVFSLTSAIATALILMLSPPFIAYGRVLGMDSVTVLFFTLVALSFLRFAKSSGKWRDYILPVIVFGLAINTRYNLVISLGLLPICVVLFASWRKNIWRWLSLVIIPIGALGVFYLTWPFLWQSPIVGLRESLGHWGQVTEWYLGQGKVFPPHSFFLVYFLATTPAVILILFITGVFRKPYNNYKLFLLSWLILPFAQSFFGLKQDGIRYLLQSWIPLAVFAGLGFELLFISIRKTWLKTVVAFVVLGYLIFNLASYYPYYLDYYNEFVGGAKGVYKNRLLQLGWWGEGGEEAASYLNSNAPSGSRIWVKFEPAPAVGPLREDLKQVSGAESPDFIVVNTELMWTQDFKIPQYYHVVYEVKAGGAPIVLVAKQNSYDLQN